MLRLPLEVSPNQEFSVQLDGISYVIKLKTFDGTAVASIAVNGVLVVSGMRFWPNQPLIPYRYLESSGGNFFFSTEGQQLPFYEQFDITQFLYYVSPTELADARA